MKLIDYIKENKGNEQITVALIEGFLIGNPPSVTDVSENQHFHQAYKDKADSLPLVKIMTAIFDRERELSKRSARYHDPLKVITYDDAFISMLQKHALPFAFYGIGNCAQRSAYAAIKLAVALKDSGITITWKNYRPKDQFICVLRKKEEWVYDPLTNPEKLFEISYYKKQILTDFQPIDKRVWKERVRVSLEVDQTQDGDLNETIKEHCKQQVSFGEADSLLQDLNFIFSLGRIIIGLERKDLLALCQEALTRLNKTRTMRSSELLEKREEAVISLSSSTCTIYNKTRSPDNEDKQETATCTL